MCLQGERVAAKNGLPASGICDGYWSYPSSAIFYHLPDEAAVTPTFTPSLVELRIPVKTQTPQQKKSGRRHWTC